MPDIPPNTGIAPTSEQIQQAQAAAAAAEATNQAWKSNTLPVLPKMGGAAISNEEQVIAYDTTGLTDPKNQQGRPYLISAQEDAARESAKHEAAFHPESFYNANIGNLANVPLSQIASRYGTDFADYVQGHYTQNPTANFQAINQQYTAMQGVTVGSAPTYKQGTMVTNIGAGEGGFTGRAAEYAASWTPLTHSVKYGGEAPNSVQGYYTPVGSNPFKSDTAAGIAWDVAASGGYIGSSLAEKVVDPTTGEKINVPGAWVWDQKTSEGKQIKDYGNVVSSNQMVEKTISPGRTVYVPIGEMEQQLRTDSKLIVAERGAYEVWQTPKNTMPGSDFVRIYPMITAGGSDFALQSGMVSGKAQTPWVVDEYGMNPLWKASDAARVADIQANPQNYSRLGSELYGGIVQKLQPYPYGTIELAWGRGQTVEPGVYPAVRENFAGLVNFESVNAPKGTVSDASDLPAFGSISPEQFREMPSLQKVDTSGNLSPATMKTVEAATPYVSTSLGYSTAETPTVSVGSSFSLDNIRESTMGQAPWIFEGLAEAGVWAGSVDLLNPVKTVINIGTNINLDIQSTKSYSGAVAHAQAHETGFFNRETLIYGNADTDQLLSTVKGGYGYVSGAEVPKGATAVAHTHTEPLPFLNALGLYSPVASAEDLSGASIKRGAGITQESVITKGGVFTYATPSSGEVMNTADEYRSSTLLGGVFGLSNTTQKEYLEKSGVKYNAAPEYTPLSGNAGSAIWEKAGEIKEETLGYVSEAVSPRSNEPVTLTPYQQSILGGYSGGLIGYQLFGEKSPEVIKGFAASVVDFFPSMAGWTPVADTMRTTDQGQADYLAGKTQKEEALQGMYTQGAEKYGVDAEGKIKIDTTNPKAVKFQNQYESARTDYTDYMKSGVDKGYTQYTSKGLVVNPDLTYNYGEYSKWGIGAGAVVRETLGYNKEQLDVYGAQLSGQKGIFSGNLTLEGLSNTGQQLVFGVGEKLSTHPEEVVTAYGAGIATVGFGEVVGVVAEASGITASLASFGAAHPVIGAIGSAAWTYGIPVALTGATYYSATEGLTASPEKATMNVGGMLPSLGAMVYGGATGFVALRGVDAGYLGFRTTKAEESNLHPNIIGDIKTIQESPYMATGSPEIGVIWNLKTGERVADLFGEQGHISGRAVVNALDRLPAGGEYGFFHTHPKTSAVDVIVTGAKDVISRDLGIVDYLRKSPSILYDLTIKQAEYVSQPSGQDIYASRHSMTTHPQIAVEGVISKQGVNIYKSSGNVLALDEIYSTPSVRARAMESPSLFPYEEELVNSYYSPAKSYKSEVDITKPLTGREALGKDVLATVDLSADQSWRYNIKQQPFGEVEPYVILGKTRVPLSEMRTTPDIGNVKLIPSEEINPLTRVMVSADVNPLESARARGVAGSGPEEAKSSMAFSMDKLLSDMGLYTQEPSARTTTMRESQRAAWQEPARIQTGEMPMDMLPGVSKIGAGLEPMALPNPFAGLADQMGLRIEPATPKGIGMSTDRGYGFSGAPMSEQMLQQVVTQGAIKTPTTYRSAMDVVIGQEEMRMRVNPAIDAATANEIVPSITQLPKGQQISGNIFDIWANIEESAKRPATVTKTSEPRLFNEPAKMVEEPLVQKTPAPIGASLSKQINTPVQTPQTSYRIATAQSPASGTVVRTSQIPGTVAGATVSPRTGLVPASIQLPKVSQTSSVGLGTVTGTTQASRQSQTPFTALTPAIDQAVTQMQIPQTVQITRQASINDAAPFVLYPLVPLSKIALPGTDPFRPSTPATGGGGGGEPGGGGGGDPGPDPEIPPPPWLPLGGSIGGQGGSGGSLKRFKRYMEYFPVGLDISMFGTTRGANPFTNPAGRVKYMPRDAGAFESPSAKRDIKAAKYAQAIRKMKPLKVPGGRKNIFMQ